MGRPSTCWNAPAGSARLDRGYSARRRRSTRSPSPASATAGIPRAAPSPRTPHREVEGVDQRRDALARASDVPARGFAPARSGSPRRRQLARVAGSSCRLAYIGAERARRAIDYRRTWRALRRSSRRSRPTSRSARRACRRCHGELRQQLAALNVSARNAGAAVGARELGGRRGVDPAAQRSRDRLFKSPDSAARPARRGAAGEGAADVARELNRRGVSKGSGGQPGLDADGSVLVAVLPEAELRRRLDVAPAPRLGASALSAARRRRSARRAAPGGARAAPSARIDQRA